MRPPRRCERLARAAVAFSVVHVAVAAAQAEWIDERTVDLFEVRSEFSLADESNRALLAELPQLRLDVETLLGIQAEERPIEVNLFANRRNYQKFLAIRVPEGNSRVALFVKGVDRGRVYVYRRRGYEVDVRHECTHALLHNALPYVPMWLDEGLAEYFEMPPAARAAGNPYVQNIRRAMFLRWNPSLSQLESLQNLRDMSGNEYRDSWAWVHFMLHGPPEARQALSNYLYDVQIGNFAGSLAERLEQEVPDAQRQLTRHFRHLSSL